VLLQLDLAADTILFDRGSMPLPIAFAFCTFPLLWGGGLLTLCATLRVDSCLELLSKLPL